MRNNTNHFWTKIRPNHEGFFFFTKDDGDHVRVLYVIHHERGFLVSHDDGHYSPIKDFNGWWCYIKRPTFTSDDIETMAIEKCWWTRAIPQGVM